MQAVATDIVLATVNVCVCVVCECMLGNGTNRYKHNQIALITLQQLLRHKA